jgi:sialic acid synthase SpsE
MPIDLSADRTYVIAECGSCHDGDLGKALALVEAAAAAGADAAKFQYWSSAARMAERRRAPEYLEVYERYAVPFDWLAMLQLRCGELGIEFMCSTYLPEDVWPVSRRRPAALKISSFEANDPELLAAHAGPMLLGMDVVVSLGMGASARMIYNWLPSSSMAFSDALVAPGRVYTLACVSAYPAPIDDLHLRRFSRRLREGQPPDVWGLSDHSPSGELLTGALAVAAGARMLERHLRLDDTDPENPDAPHACSPAQFRGYVELVRLAERALGPRDVPSTGTVMPSETAMARYRVGAPMGGETDAQL